GGTQETGSLSRHRTRPSRATPVLPLGDTPYCQPAPGTSSGQRTRSRRSRRSARMASGIWMVKDVGSIKISSARCGLSGARDAPQDTRRYHVPLQMLSLPTLAVSCLMWLSIHEASAQPSALLLALQPQRGHPTAVVEGLIRGIVLHIRLPG